MNDVRRHAKRRFLGGCAFVVLGATAVRAEPSPAPSPSYAYAFTPAPASGSPRIIKVELNSDHLHAGGPIAIRVTTTPDVVTVVTGNGFKSGTLDRSGDGVFTTESTLPRFGGFVFLHISLHVVGTTASGRSASVDVPVLYR